MSSSQKLGVPSRMRLLNILRSFPVEIAENDEHVPAISCNRATLSSSSAERGWVCMAIYGYPLGSQLECWLATPQGSG